MKTLNVPGSVPPGPGLGNTVIGYLGYSLGSDRHSIRPCINGLKINKFEFPYLN